MKTAILATLFLLVSCSSTSVITIKRRVPPKIDARKYKTVAVEPLVGDNNKAFSNILIQELLKEKRMKVMQRDNITPLIREEVLNHKGNLKRAELVVSGGVQEYFDSQVFNEGGKVDGYKLREYAETKANLTITDTSTGEILYSGEQLGSQRGSSPWIQPEEAIAYSKRPALIKEAREMAAKQLVGVMYPYQEEVRAYVFYDDSTPELQEARAFYFQNKHEESLKKFETALKSNTITPEGVASAYSLMAFIKGFKQEKYDEAIEFMNKAEGAKSSKELAYNKELMIESKEQSEKIKKLGL